MDRTAARPTWIVIKGARRVDEAMRRRLLTTAALGLLVACTGADRWIGSQVAAGGSTIGGGGRDGEGPGGAGGREDSPLEGGRAGELPVVSEAADADGNEVLDGRDILAARAGRTITEAEIEELGDSACAKKTVAAAEPIAATLFLTVDASSSMMDDAEGTGGRSKWEVTREAIGLALDQLPDRMRVGLLAYPNREVTQEAGDAANCINLERMVRPSPLESNREILKRALDSVHLSACTPTADAYVTAVAELQTDPVYTAQRYVLLITDGQPTYQLGCSPSGPCNAENVGTGAEAEVVEAVAQAQANYGIRTFVLGSPGSELHLETGEDNRWWLSQAAELGGTAVAGCSHEGEPYCHFDMTGEHDFGQALEGALSLVLGEVVECEYDLEAEVGIDDDQMNLFLRPESSGPLLVYRQSSPECLHGWYLDEATRHASLCAATCEAVKDDAPLAEWLFGCESVYVR